MADTVSEAEAERQRYELILRGKSRWRGEHTPSPFATAYVLERRGDSNWPSLDLLFVAEGKDELRILLDTLGLEADPGQGMDDMGCTFSDRWSAMKRIWLREKGSKGGK